PPPTPPAPPCCSSTSPPPAPPPRSGAASPASCADSPTRGSPCSSSSTTSPSCAPSPTASSRSMPGAWLPRARAPRRPPARAGRGRRRLRDVPPGARDADDRRRRAFSRTPYLGSAIEDGARLAASEIDAAGLHVGDREYELRVVTMDDALSAARAVANVRSAVERHAVAIVNEGTGVDAAWRVARGTPIGIVFQGGRGLVDPVTRRNVFRIAPTDHGIAFRLAEYLVPKGYRVALLHDDSDYGDAGAGELRRAFAG